MKGLNVSDATKGQTNRQPSGRLGLARRVAVATAFAVSVLVPVLTVAASPASATANDCHSYITSNGRPGGGNSGICNGGNGWWQEVGLCQNVFNLSSHFIDGPWVNSGVSYVGCRWYEKPIGGYVRIGS